VGRINASGKSSILDERRLNKAFYSSIHRCKVNDVNFSNGTMAVEFLDGGSYLPNVPLPLMGFSFPPKGDPESAAKDQNFRKTAWGVYYPQEGDITLIGFDALGAPYSLGYYSFDFGAMDRADEANEDRGGIGWGNASGKRLKPGDWHFKSGRNCFLYLGDRARIASGPHSITLDKNTTNSEISIQTDHLHTWYGNASEKREGTARRLLVPGVDSIESPVDGLFGTPAQECTNYVKRSSLTAVGGLLMVHDSLGEVVDDDTKQVMVPSVAYPELTSLVGTSVRAYRAIKDDATGVIDLYTEVVDNLGNRGFSAKTATGFQWFTPLAMWDIANLSTSWTVTSTFDLTVGVSASISAAANLKLEGKVLASLVSDVAVRLGSEGATEFLLKGTSFVSQLSTFLTGLGLFVGAIQGDTGLKAVAPATVAAAGTFVPILTAFGLSLSSMLSVKVATQ